MRFIDFYEKNKIIPVVDSKDIKKKIYSDQRKNFYYALKINLKNLENKNVLELCPGTGANAQFLLNQGIKKITLVDYNSESVKSCNQKFSNLGKKVKIIYQDIFKFNTKEKFDYVIIENALSNFDDPFVILEKVSKMLKKNGHLIFSFCDEYSLFSEKIRGYIARIIILNKEQEKNRSFSFKEKTKFLSKIFNSHLKKLKTNTRFIDKWVQDNLLLEEWWSKKNYLPLNVVIDFFKKKKINLDYWSSSPIVYKDFTWYKKLSLKKTNQEISRFYKSEQINFIDLRERYDQLKNLKKIRLFINSLNKEINNSISDSKINYNNIKKIIKINHMFISYLKKYNKKNLTAKSLEGLNSFLKNIVKNKSVNIKHLKTYADFWGKGTMQVSFIKN